MSCIVQTLIHTPLLRDYFLSDRHFCLLEQETEQEKERNVLPGTKPPSVLNLSQESLKSQADRTLTSFYLPAETEKTLCVTNATTTRDVIRSLLSKFRIVDNPHQYVLYERKTSTCQSYDQ